jgi:hypothetical protein
MKKPITQTYNDGVIAVYSVGNIALPGDRPKDGLLLKFENPIPYEERTVGVTRFVLNMQVQSTIEKLLRIPYVKGISRDDVVVPIDGEQYKIKQVQIIKDVEPKSLDLSLERVANRYEFG